MTSRQEAVWDRIQTIDPRARKFAQLADGSIGVRYVPKYEQVHGGRIGLCREIEAHIHPDGRLHYYERHSERCPDGIPTPRPTVDDIRHTMRTSLIRRMPDARVTPLPNAPRRVNDGMAQSSERPAGRAPVEGYKVVTRQQQRDAVRQEQALVNDFCAFLRRHNRDPVQETIVVHGQRIEYDVFDKTTRALFEAKADARDRDQIRMAIGQLLDYEYFGFRKRQRKPLRKALLLPERPSPDICELLDDLGIGIAWRAGASEFVEECSH